MNRFIIGQSSSGKTKELLEVAKSSDAVVVCRNPDAMRVKAQNYGIHRLKFCGYDDVYDIGAGEKIVVDEIGEFFKFIYGDELVGFNMTTENI